MKIDIFPSGDALRGVAIEETLSALSVPSQSGVVDKCVDPNLHFSAISISFTNDSHKDCQSGAEDRPSIAWCVAKCIVFHPILANLYI